MKIGVISDTHGSLQSWREALQGPFCDAELVFHAGDVLYHGPRNPLPIGYEANQLAEEINNCPIPLVIAKGNCDSEVDQMVINMPIQEPFALVTNMMGRFLVTHGHRYDAQQAELLAGSYKIDVWISGHTHIPSLVRKGDTIFLNPGSVSLPKGGYKPTVAVITGQTVEIVELASGQVVDSLRR